MFAHVQLHPRMQRQHNQFAGGVARESDSTRAVRDTDDERHPGKRALNASLQRHDRHRRVIVFPKQNVMLKENRVALSEIQFRDRHDLAFDLTCAHAKVNFSHVADARGFAPTGFAHQITNVQRRAAGPA